MSGKALNKQEMDSIDLAKFVFAFAVIHIQYLLGILSLDFSRLFLCS